LNHFKDREFGDFFSGHVTPRNKEYRQYSDERLDEEYKNSIEDLTVFESIPDLSGVHEELKEKEDRIRKLEERLQYLSDELGIRVLKELKDFEQKKK